ncbi:hypothetical protein [Alicyclobacillus fastidiosus]|uniref:hypothetical protein n=1 Tax=Alicyclobacillus fastidiosus TaxID=392011 RepID=UPI0023E99947|nr:hypothetical protein [Alicyclobacillus fastidiosus]GMA66073.1 hypothetical protein GCM10025859_65150 [Alicyclobacillus fastidiosus]
MFIIKCVSFGKEQHWDEGVTLGVGTVIEVANRAVYYECGGGTRRTKECEVQTIN